MRTTWIIAITLFLLMATATGFVWHNRVKAMDITIAVRDLKDHGIEIIAPSDQLFDYKAAGFLREQPQGVIQGLKPFSVIVSNTSNLSIVAYCLKWEVIRQDGSRLALPAAYANHRALMDGGEAGTETLQTGSGVAIPSNSTRFVSVVGSIEEGGKADLHLEWFGFRGSRTEMDQYKEELVKHDSVALLKRAYNQYINGASGIVVSIDGAFFEDGTFVGDDTTGFFKEIKAHVDAEYDLLTDIALAKSRKETPESIYSRVSEIVKGRSQIYNQHKSQSGEASSKFSSESIESSPTYDQFTGDYNTERINYAQHLLRMKDSLGSDRALIESLKPLLKPRIQLRKTK